MHDIDILKEIDNSLNKIDNSTAPYLTLEALEELEEKGNVYHYKVFVTEQKKKNRLVSSSIFLVKYITTSSLIFLVLLLSTNYSAYISVAKSYLASDEKIEETRNSIMNSVEAAQISVSTGEELDENNLENNIENHEQLSINKYKKELENSDINLSIDITTLENRVIIPKIGKNVPLLDVKNRSISGASELNDILMEELESGIVRYPGSAKPGEDGLSFIFGHSSNFPWVKGDYNDVFATLDRVMLGDEIIVYYDQKKYTFKVIERAIIKPGDVGILKRNMKKPEVAIMTCRPLGTTAKRFVVVGELVD